ncbi:MAG: hypothetical protein MZV70_17900 [Desulfobacterales bacterium]|nr:hypothetical protein [Desulfobacterales bacterium]
MGSWIPVLSGAKTETKDDASTADLRPALAPEWEAEDVSPGAGLPITVSVEHAMTSAEAMIDTARRRQDLQERGG